ncbi:MAG: transposon-encoded TnpW family protein [Clostridia bacterium]|nr:transposon-encoded TnpW family protein [Clostridia bacterium]
MITNNTANNIVIYQEQPDGSLARIRERRIGNTVYTIIARQKPNAKETAFDITKRLIEQNADSLIYAEPLGSCNSGGIKQ